MKGLLIDPFFTGSHKVWGHQLQKHLAVEIDFLCLPGIHWKWRMEGAALELAERFKSIEKPDFIIATDMLNLPLFYAFAGIQKEEIPCILYFHENQFAYPSSPLDTDVKQKRDNHYGFINYTSALFANQVVFNSNFNKNSFLIGVDLLLKKLPDKGKSPSAKEIAQKCDVIYPGIETPGFIGTKPATPHILWNHRWEHDKNPRAFVKFLQTLKMESIDFKLIVLGRGTEKDNVKNELISLFGSELIHAGYTESKEEYWKLLGLATHLPVTSSHDFFGISVGEAMEMGAIALLPNHQAYPEHDGIIYKDYNLLHELFLQEKENRGTGIKNQKFQWDTLKSQWMNKINELN